MSLVVTNQAGKKSEEFSRPFQVTEDTDAPEVVATPISSDWTNKPVTVDVSLSDKGGSKVKGYTYAITNSKEMPTSWSDIIPKENDTITIDTEGEKYLHIIGYDNAGNASEDRVLGPYKIDLSKPEVKNIVPENKDWTKESVDINVAFSDKGGSGFSGYKYAITTSKATPENWSEVVEEENAKFEITGESEYYLHIIMYDKAGNESDENIYGPYQVDKTAPQVKATPSFSDWTNQPVTVDIELSDEGGSDLQKYKYAVTNSGVMPEEWKNATGQPEPIVIDLEGENYLHVIGQDHAGNESPDNIFGKYKLDFTLPELISDNDTSSDEQLFSMKFIAKDELSGIKKFTVNGSEISGTEYIVTKNGDYTFEVLDNAGNVLTKSLRISNLYGKCEKDLGHPNFSTSYEKCPICDLLDGVKVTSSEKIYEGKPISVSYENTKNAKIVEYYEDSLDKPSKVGEYSYELKVNYEGTEYNTGIKGVLVIHKKAINIDGLKLEDKVYDGKTEVNIDKTDLKVEGMIDSDKNYITLEVADKTNYDITSLGEKTVILQKDTDYKLNLKENVDTSYHEIINCYELPETLVVVGKLMAKETPKSEENKNDTEHSKNEDSTKNEETNSTNTENTSQNQTIDKKRKDKTLGKLLYTGHKIESSLIIVSCVVIFFNMISGKIVTGGKHSKKKKPRILEKAIKK